MKIIDPAGAHGISQTVESSSMSSSVSPGNPQLTSVPRWKPGIDESASFAKFADYLISGFFQPSRVWDDAVIVVADLFMEGIWEDPSISGAELLEGSMAYLVETITLQNINQDLNTLSKNSFFFSFFCQSWCLRMESRRFFPDVIDRNLEDSIGPNSFTRRLTASFMRSSSSRILVFILIPPILQIQLGLLLVIYKLSETCIFL